ncbi:MAG: hypothetical protein K2K02_09965 [Ruminococcus sp.]|nr:hypothetical protein [Ruminococcus sp.]
MPVYPNFYQNTYQPMNQPYQQYQPYTQYQIPQQTNQQSQNGIIWVQGEAGAKSFVVANGQSVWLMDSENPVFYLKSTDQSGIPLPLRIFDFTERTAQNTSAPETQSFAGTDMTNYITRQEFEEKLSQLLKQKGVNENAESIV